MYNFRKKLSDILNVWTGASIWCRVYDVVMILAIIMGLLPLAFHEKYYFFHYTDIVVVTIFITDYILRWITADFRIKKGKWSFLIYPVTFFALVDLICILPLFTDFGLGVRFAMLLRLVYTLRFIKFIRYSKSIMILANVFKKYGYILASIFFIMIIYLLLAALVIFNVEPDTFPNFFEALYWSVVTMVTVGYGDITPVTVGGRIVAMISSIIGIIIFALPSGFIAAAFVKELSKYREKEAKDKEYYSNIKDIEKRIEELEKKEQDESKNEIDSIEK